EACAVARVGVWYIGVACVLVEEVIGNQEAIGDPGQGFEAQIGVDDRQIRVQFPLLGGGQLGAGLVGVEAQNAQPAHRAIGVVALGGHVDGRCVVGARDTFRIGN